MIVTSRGQRVHFQMVRFLSLWPLHLIMCTATDAHPSLSDKWLFKTYFPSKGSGDSNAACLYALKIESRIYCLLRSSYSWGTPLTHNEICYTTSQIEAYDSHYLWKHIYFKCTDSPQQPALRKAKKSTGLDIINLPVP